MKSARGENRGDRRAFLVLAYEEPRADALNTVSQYRVLVCPNVELNVACLRSTPRIPGPKVATLFNAEMID